MVCLESAIIKKSQLPYFDLTAYLLKNPEQRDGSYGFSMTKK